MLHHAPVPLTRNSPYRAVVRGPNIPAGLVINDSALHVDLTPTLLDMMGISETPMQMDGRSWLGLVRPTNGNPLVARTDEFGTRTFMVEYSGGGDPEGAYSALVRGDTAGATAPAFCTADGSDENSLQGKCSCTFGAAGGLVHDQSPCDGANNTYACIRTLGPQENTMFCVFDDTEGECWPPHGYPQRSPPSFSITAQAHCDAIRNLNDST
jgi:hypothetical protein